MNADTLEPAYLLHLRRYRNTSALTDIFTPNHGRLGAVVKGIFSKGTHAQQLRGQLQLATPLLIAFSGRSELKSVTHVEAVGHALIPYTQTLHMQAIPAVVDPAPQGIGNALYCVMYLNELLVRLLPAQLFCPSLFAAYQLALEQLARKDNPERVLRRFELQLLDTLGYGINFGVTSDGEQPILAQGNYCFVPAMGFVSQSQAGGQANEFVGSDLLAMGAGEFNDDATLRAAKRLMRLTINHHLNGRPLNSRALFKPSRPD